MRESYSNPKLNGQRVLWKGRRYWVIEVTPELPYDFVNSKLGDAVLYDGLYDAIAATATKLTDGTYECSLISHVEILCYASSVRDIAKVVPPVLDDYLKRC